MYCRESAITCIFLCILRVILSTIRLETEQSTVTVQLDLMLPPSEPMVPQQESQTPKFKQSSINPSQEEQIQEENANGSMDLQSISMKYSTSKEVIETPGDNIWSEEMIPEKNMVGIEKQLNTHLLSKNPLFNLKKNTIWSLVNKKAKIFSKIFKPMKTKKNYKKNPEKTITKNNKKNLKTLKKPSNHLTLTLTTTNPKINPSPQKKLNNNSLKKPNKINRKKTNPKPKKPKNL